MPQILPLLVLLQLALLPSLFSQSSEQLRANLNSFNANETVSLTDGNLTLYNISNSNDINGMDAIKMTNFGENFGLLRGTSTLAIERRQPITGADTIFFTMWNMRQKKYRLDLFLKGLAHPDLTGILEDKYLATKTSLNLNGANSLVFTISNDTASYNTGRFRIIFSLLSSFKVLPITFSGVKAFQQSNYINVEWGVENEKDVTQYVMHSSVNGQRFLPVAIINAKGKSTSLYSWTDFSAKKGNHFYRISSIDIHGNIINSNVIKVSAAKQAYLVSVYPNPVINGHINVQLTNQPKGIYTASLMNNYGQIVHKARLLHAGGSSKQILQANKKVVKGIYILEIITPDDNRINCKVFIQ